MTTPHSNSLISETKTSDSGLHASLHPLVLLTISDYITRHSLRGHTTPIVGALLGQQKGREITIEHAYDVKTLSPGDTGTEWKLHEAFFAERLQQYKDVHKEPALELVGWWTVSAASGPGLEVLGIHRHILQTFNESSLLLAFHPSDMHKTRSGGQTSGQLPLTIYESVYEAAKGDFDGDAIMQDDGQDEEKNTAKLEIKLRELPYEVVTGEAEMIALDFVAKGSGNATTIDQTSTHDELKENTTADKGKSVATPQSEEGGKKKSTPGALNPQEEESKLRF
jgi:COP9 signalosome complex subunit 6